MSDDAGGIVPEYLTSRSKLEGLVVVTAAGWIVNQFVLRPTQWFISAFEDATLAVSGAYSDAYDGVARGFGPAADAVISVPELILGSIERGLTSLGLGAPIAATVAAVIALLIFWTVAIVLARVAVDAVPGLGGLMR